MLGVIMGRTTPLIYMERFANTKLEGRSGHRGGQMNEIVQGSLYM